MVNTNSCIDDSSVCCLIILGRVLWTEDETNDLIRGVLKFGDYSNKWKLIHQHV